jgi:hypothetical protein
MRTTDDRSRAIRLTLCCLAMLLPQLPNEIAASDETKQDQPSRSFRTDKFLYIRNFSPASWPSDEPAGQPRPDEELYDLVKDPEQLKTVVNDEKYADDRVRLSDQLTAQLRESGDSIFQLANHATFTVHGWSIHLHDQLWRDQSAKTKTMLALLSVQLKQIENVVPAKALVQIKTVPIWINPAYEGVWPTAEFHPDARWLRDNGRDPAMEKSVELTNVMKFQFENTRMPMLMLHELAHAYHDLVIGFRHPKVRAAFEAAKESGRYDEVKRFTGRKIINDKAYAMSNDREYFAESTEAYFGKNDFFPFTREELKKHDPGMHDLLSELWGGKLGVGRIVR